MSRTIVSEGAPEIPFLPDLLKYEASLPGIDPDDRLVSAMTLEQGSRITDSSSYSYASMEVIHEIGRRVYREQRRAEIDYYKAEEQNKGAQ